MTTSRSEPLVRVDDSIDDLLTNLSPNAVRVYMHLARRSQEDAPRPSMQAIGDHCFVSIYRHRDTRRRHASSAIKELVSAGLIEKETHELVTFP